MNPNEITLREFVEILDGRPFKNYGGRIIVIFPDEAAQS